MSFCVWCDKEFDKKSQKQIYCSTECRHQASKEKILERYHIEKRKKRKSRTRLCAGGCNTPLSVYNDSGLCSKCIVNKKRLNNFVKELKDYFDYEIQ